MLARAIGLGPARPGVQRWLLGKRSALQFASIVILALASFALSAFVGERNWNARSWVGHSRDVQTAIDRIVWHLMSLQQAMQAQRLTHDPEQEARFNRIRGGIQQDAGELARLAADNAHQQNLIAQFNEVLAQYLVKIDRIAASEWGAVAVKSVAAGMSLDAVRISDLIAAMREYEDALLRGRSARADLLLAVLLLTLSLSAAFIAVVGLTAGLSINRLMRERNFKLAEQECEITAQGMMMREVDHRVRNSLGLVYNLMTFQQQRAGNTEATRELLAEVANQVLVVARLHERLYKSGAPDRLRIGQYLRELCDDIGAYSLPEASRAAIRVQAVETEVPAEQAVWLGLIVVEFVTNALKYANPSVQAPVLIDVAADAGQLQVSVADRGAGLPAAFDPSACKGLGMQVAALLVRQLHGTLGIDRAWAGARFIVTVPIAATSTRG